MGVNRSRSESVVGFVPPPAPRQGWYREGMEEEEEAYFSTNVAGFMHLQSGVFQTLLLFLRVNDEVQLC